MTQVGLRTRLDSELRTRALRIRASNLQPVVKVVVNVGQVVAALLCVMVLTGWRGPSVPNRLTGSSYSPWQSVITVVALGVITVALSIGAVRTTMARRVLLSATAVVLSLLAMDALTLGPGRPWLLGIGLACIAVAVGLPPGRPATEVLRCLLAAVPFAMALVATARSSEVEHVLAGLRDAQLAPAAAILLSMLAVFAVASSVQEQRERTGQLLAWRVTLSAVIATAIVKLVLLVALYLHVTGGFLGGERMWRARLDSPLSWLHAAIVAVLIGFVASRSWRRPLRSGDFTVRLGILSLVVAVMEMAALITLVAITVVSAISPLTNTSALFDLPNWVIEHVELIQLTGAALILLAALAQLAVSRVLSSGLYLWLAAGTWLLPALLGIAFASHDTPTAWATPGQVETVLTVLVLAMALARRPRGLPPRALMVLLVVPLVVLHLTSFWPDAWMDHVTQIAVVAAVVLSLWVNPPPVYADRRRNERARALLVAGQLGVLTLYLYLFNDAGLTGGLGAATTLAWLWLGVPITAVLTARVAKRDPAAVL